MIPLCDLKKQYLSLQEEIDAAMRRVAASGHYVLGPQVKAFECEMAEYIGCKYAIGVNSGTDALHLSLRAMGIGPGDEVITTPFTFIATTEAIGMVGAVPVFVDIDTRTFNMDPTKIEAAITPRTRAILPVHLFGQPCDMDAIMEIARQHDVQIVEDSAQALGAEYRGAKVGTIGNVGCLSFFPSKNLGCFGDGGMVVTNDRELYEQVEMLRRHGGKAKYHHDRLGLNSRLDEIQAAVLRVKLRHLDTWNARRRTVAYQYNEMLQDSPYVSLPEELDDDGLIVPAGCDVRQNLRLTSVYHQYTIQVQDREFISRQLQELGVQSSSYYPVPLHLQQVHAPLGLRSGDFPGAEQVSNRCLSLPMFPEITEQQQMDVAHRLREALFSSKLPQQNVATC